MGTLLDTHVNVLMVALVAHATGILGASLSAARVRLV